MSRLLDAGSDRSLTFAGLLDSLENSDVIVHVVEVPYLPPSTHAQVLLLPVKSDVRMLRVQMGNRRGGDDLVALLGHELFHALEIARASEVRDDRTLTAMYRRIGFETGRDQQFETDQARHVERQIRQELAAACRQRAEIKAS